MVATTGGGLNPGLKRKVSVPEPKLSRSIHCDAGSDRGVTRKGKPPRGVNGPPSASSPIDSRKGVLALGATGESTRGGGGSSTSGAGGEEGHDLGEYIVLVTPTLADVSTLVEALEAPQVLGMECRVVCPLYEWNQEQDEEEMCRLRTFPQVWRVLVTIGVEATSAPSCGVVPFCFHAVDILLPSTLLYSVVCVLGALVPSLIPPCPRLSTLRFPSPRLYPANGHVKLLAFGCCKPYNVT